MDCHTILTYKLSTVVQPSRKTHGTMFKRPSQIYPGFWISAFDNVCRLTGLPDVNVPSISLFIYIRTKRDETRLWLPWAKFLHCHGSLGPSLSCWFEIKSWDYLNIAFIGLPPASQYYKAWDRKSLEQRRTKPQARSIKHRSKWRSSNDWSELKRFRSTSWRLRLRRL